MRHIILIFLCASLISITAKVNAQNISDCLGAITLCESFYFEEQAPLNTGDVLENTGACNNGVEWNSVWYTFTVQGDGNLGFVITPNELNDDYDWGLFNITNGGCAGITAQDGSSPEVSCNAWGTLTPPNGPTGISTAQGGVSNSGGPGDQFGPPFNADLPVIQGQTYALVVMNWTASTYGYSIDFAESTAVLFDAVAPTMEDAIISCSNDELLLVFSEPVVVVSAQDLDFVVEGPQDMDVIAATTAGGADLSQSLLLEFSGLITTPGTYDLIITDVSGLIEDPCGNAAPDTISFEVVEPINVAYNIEPACNGFGGQFEVVAVSSLLDFTATIGQQSILLGQVVELTAGDHELVVVSENGCELDFTIEIPNETLILDVFFADTLTCLQPLAHFDINVVSNVSTLNYSWSTLEGSLQQANEADAIALEPGVYFCTITTEPNGCSVTDSFPVVSTEIYTISNDLIVWPNIVSPNQDNKNDWWAPRLISNSDEDITNLFSLYDLQIMDRWGKLVFEGNASRVWRPAGLSAGVYFYTIRYKIDCGSDGEYTKEGSIQIIE